MLNKSDVKVLPNILGQLLLLTIVIFGCFALNKQVYATIVQQPLEAAQKEISIKLLVILLPMNRLAYKFRIRRFRIII